MVRVFVRHTVSDYASWRQVYDDFDAVRRRMGVTGHAVYQSLEDPNDVTTWHDFDSEETARAFIESSELADAMQGAGVAGPPEIWLTSPS